MWRAALLLLALPRPCLGARLCRVARLAGLEGQIEGRGRPVPTGEESPWDCAWHIQPNVWLRSIAFTVEEAHFADGDRLSFYSTSAGPGEAAPLLFAASARNPLPPELLLSGGSEVLLVLSASSEQTVLRLSYRCEAAVQRFGGLYLSPAVYASLLAAMVFLGCLMGFVVLPMAAYSICKQCSRTQERRRDGVPDESSPPPSLEALPTLTWSEVKQRTSRDDMDCCLCLESFQDGDSLRLLPCEHFFHRACVDRWFATQRRQPRTCPQCRHDPTSPVSTPVRVVAPTALGRPQDTDAPGTPPGEPAEPAEPAAPPVAGLLLPGEVP